MLVGETALPAQPRQFFDPLVLVQDCMRTCRAIWDESDGEKSSWGVFSEKVFDVTDGRADPNRRR